MRHRGLAASAAVMSALAFLAPLGCSTSSSGAAHGSDTRAIAQALMRLDDEWSAAAATRNADKVGGFYAPDAIAYPPNQPAVIGRDAATKVWAEYFKDPSFGISWKSDRAEAAASGEIGYTAGSYQAWYNGPDSRRIVENGKFLCVWKKQPDGSWKASRDMWNTDSK